MSKTVNFDSQSIESRKTLEMELPAKGRSKKICLGGFNWGEKRQSEKKKKKKGRPIGLKSPL